jgi:hypothetical protein
MAPATGSTSQNCGAKRSTKSAGKLKVLTEQPESKPADDTFRIPPRKKSPGKTGESDDRDIDGDEEDEEPEVEVCDLPISLS